MMGFKKCGLEMAGITNIALLYCTCVQMQKKLIQMQLPPS
jgi:hypothetical protein